MLEAKLRSLKTVHPHKGRPGEPLGVKRPGMTTMQLLVISKSLVIIASLSTWAYMLWLTCIKSLRSCSSHSPNSKCAPLVGRTGPSQHSSSRCLFSQALTTRGFGDCAKICVERLYEIIVVRAEIGDFDRWADIILSNPNFAITVLQQAAHRLSNASGSNAALRAQLADTQLRVRIGEDLIGRMSEAWRTKRCYCSRRSWTYKHELVGSFATGTLAARCKTCGFIHPI